MNIRMIWQEKSDRQTGNVKRACILTLDVNMRENPEKIKFRDVRDAMKEAGANVHIISSMDDIVWLLNIRGNDIIYNPVVMSYVMVTMEQVHFYVQEEAVSEQVRAELEKAGVVLHDYFAIYEDVKELAETAKLCWKMPAPTILYIKIFREMKSFSRANPAAIMKGCKNEQRETLNCPYQRCKGNVQIYLLV